MMYREEKKICDHANPFKRAIENWVKCDGDHTFRVNYDLNNKSVVYDLGGYHGDFTQEIVDRYDCEVFVFEPVPQYVELIKNRFKGNEKVHVYCFGLDKENADEILYMSDDGSSVYKNNDKEKINIKYVSVSDFFRENNVRNIDLMKINIEGGEYTLLEHMIETGD